MKKNSFETILYSVVGVAMLLVVLVAFNLLSGAAKQRIDLTKEKAFTLSTGTKVILQKLEAPIKIRYYYSRSQSGSPEVLFLKTYAQHVEDLLAEYKQLAKGKIILEKYDPEPDSDAEDSARLDGVEGQMLPNGEKFYLGLSVSRLDEKEAIPFLAPNKERLLEYDLTRAISRVVTPDKPVIGVMSSLPVFGAPSNPMMARMGQQQGQEPWVFISELKNNFTVKTVEMTADKIDDAIKVLVVIHPKEITDTAQYAIDQFIMRGGKLIAFFDATSLVDSRSANPMMQMPGGGSSFDKLLAAWGIQFDTGKVAADLNYKMRLMGRNNQPTDAPGFLSITTDGINKDDVATSQIDNIWVPFGGAFSGTPVAGLKETVLLKTTKDSQLVDGMMAAMSGDNILKDFKSSGTEQALAIRLTGKFKTAFPNGKPEEKKEDAKDSKDKPAEKKADDSLKETKGDNVVVLFGDADMLADQFTLRQMQSPFGNITSLMNGNLNLAQNIVENLSGDSNLISVRSRATLNRPFTRIREMETQAEKNYQSKIKELEDSLQETRQRVNELQKSKDNNGQRFILSPEQQAEQEKFQKKLVDVNVQLKAERKKLAHDKDALENRLKWANIIGMPALVAMSGIGLAVFKRKRTSAK
ncbi:MAG: putative transporter, rane protein [Pedosphaera sp.]|nr:putative transporter, rane protein [Pedosphaera sp.]